MKTRPTIFFTADEHYGHGHIIIAGNFTAILMENCRPSANNGI